MAEKRHRLLWFWSDEGFVFTVVGVLTAALFAFPLISPGCGLSGLGG